MATSITPSRQSGAQHYDVKPYGKTGGRKYKFFAAYNNKPVMVTVHNMATKTDARLTAEKLGFNT